MKNGVYNIQNIITGDCYIGSCASKSGYKARWTNHKNDLRKGKHHSIILQNAWNKYSEENFIFFMLEYCEPVMCIEREQYYMDNLNPKYNVAEVAGSNLGVKQSEETKKKLRNRSYDWMRGDNNWNRLPENRKSLRDRILRNPIKQTEDGWKKISEFHKGKSKTEEHRAKISISNKGKQKSQEQLEKMRKWQVEHNTGDKCHFSKDRYIFSGESNSKFSGYFKFKHKLTNEEFIGSKIEFTNKFNLEHTKVCAICNGKRKSTKKWVFIEKILK
jgi:group I intron endonuclease